MQSSSRALGALRRSAAKKNCGAWSSLQQRHVEAPSTSCGDLETWNEFEPLPKSPHHFEKIKKESADMIFPHTDMHERGFIGTEFDEASSFRSLPRWNRGCEYDRKSPSGGFTNCMQTSSLMFSNSYMVARRHFASKSKSGDDDEDVLDDVESRLIGQNYERDDMYVGDSSYATGAANFEEYGEWANGEENSATEGEGESDTDGEGLDKGSDEDSEEETANEQSDEEFEDEQTDEELDELLASTPLFDPPEAEEFRPDVPVPEFSFRPEGPVYYPGMEYEPEDLDVTKPLPPRKREMRPKEEISVEEVIDNADFRNVRYLTRFIGETGNIIARKEFKMRNKSHNRITKAIKTARFFGLMPYTNMGRPKYVFNEPFDEFSEFYETDEDEKKLEDIAAGRNFQSSSENSPPSGGSYFGQGWGGGYSGQFTGRRL